MEYRNVFKVKFFGLITMVGRFHRRPRRNHIADAATKEVRAYFLAPTDEGDVEVPIVQYEPLTAEIRAVLDASGSSDAKRVYAPFLMRAPADHYKIVDFEQIGLTAEEADQIGLHIVTEHDLAWSAALDDDAERA